MSNLDGFIKLNRKTLELLETDQDAFLLMSQISLRALRKESKYNRHKLKVGQAFIGDYESIGLTRQRYRDAQERIQQVYELATFQGTNKGTIATLLNIEFCDINIESEEPTENHQKTHKIKSKAEKEPTENQQGNHQFSLVESTENNQQENTKGTNKEPTENQQGTTKEEVKKKRNKEVKNNKYSREKFSSSEIVEFPPHVWMPIKEYENLLNEIGEFYVAFHIKGINQWIEEGKGNYSCFSRAIRDWHEKAKEWDKLPKGGKYETIKPSDKPNNERFKSKHSYKL